MLALWSINERLGGKPGLDMEMPDLSFLDDMLDMAGQEIEAMEEPESIY